MDTLKPTRIQEIESMLRDPLITQERSSTLSAEKSALSSSPAATKGPESMNSEGGQRFNETPGAEDKTKLETSSVSPWRVGLAQSSSKMMSASKKVISTQGFMFEEIDMSAPPVKKSWVELIRGEAKEASRMVGALAVHTLTASAVGFAVAGPVGALVLPLLNFYIDLYASTLVMAAAPYLASKTIKAVEIGSGLLEKISARRAELAVAAPQPGAASAPKI